jgi:hypothetical protein
LQRWGRDCGIAWVPPTDEICDDTGYFHSRDATKLQREFLGWLQGLAQRLLELETDGSRGFAISMPTDVRFEVDAFLTTPLGPRTVQWVREVAEDPSRGIDVFPWWELGKGPRYALGRALAHMWTDLPWRPPVDAEEQRLFRRVDELLGQARGVDARLPAAEWAELRRHLASEPVAGEDAAVAGTIGYRRRDVWNALSGGWSLRAPGAFVGRFDEDQTWSAFDGIRTLWFSSFSVRGPDGTMPAAADVLPKEPAKGEAVEVEELQGRPHRAHLWITDDGDGPYTLLQVEVAARGSLGVLTVAFGADADRALAVRIAGTLAHAEAPKT